MNTRLIAHRGASANAQENTLESFQLAFIQGADGVEGDFLLTRDRKLIAYHDLNTKRLLQKDLSTKTLNLSEIRKLSPYQIPELYEVLNIIPQGKGLVIELKCGRQVEKILIDTLRSSQIKFESITVISFRLPTLIRLRKICPQIKILWIRNFRLSKEKFNPCLEETRAVIEKCNFDGISANANRINQEFIKAFEGLEINCWTVDSSQRYRELEQLGCHSISTNRPGYIQTSLQREKS
ncbi:glycerophosphoryl diester phosphodiesterase [Lentisphaera araneosa HTCC2155]|uniref:Glycerophosphoryl diester phosphodiesterase n=1 Tax=Lentisphaera araneosa HTCC2155 TaxID=313628 RepID=A6DS11_9BACT|nr:glycerophosphodiester phosphodiesterase [Lentisphaera araneosa]EDM25586.1 glycerophosphoryl diester phosphodiesterase [Lentisphaera araneosa HTCC2155]